MRTRLVLLLLSVFSSISYSDFALAIIQDDDGYTNIRSGPGSKYEILFTISENEYFLVEKDVSNWWTVKNGSNLGYIYRSRVKFVSDMSKAEQVRRVLGVYNYLGVDISPEKDPLPPQAIRTDTLDLRKEINRIMAELFCYSKDEYVLDAFIRYMTSVDNSENNAENKYFAICRGCDEKIVDDFIGDTYSRNWRYLERCLEVGNSILLKLRIDALSRSQVMGLLQAFKEYHIATIHNMDPTTTEDTHEEVIETKHGINLGYDYFGVYDRMRDIILEFNDEELLHEFLKTIIILYPASADETPSWVLGEIYIENEELVLSAISKYDLPDFDVVTAALIYGYADIEYEEENCDEKCPELKNRLEKIRAEKSSP